MADEIKKTKEFQFTWKWHVINFEQFNDLLNQSDKTIREENVLDQVYDLLMHTNLYSSNKQNVCIYYLEFSIVDESTFSCSYCCRSSSTVSYKYYSELY